MIKKFPIILVAIIGLSSCASWYDVKVDQPAAYHAPTQIDNNYNIDGRFTIRTASKDYYGNFNWQHESANDVLAFMSPLGSTVAKIVVESDVATLTTEDNESYSGSDLDQMMNKQLGFSLPLQYLHYWIQGIPLPNYPVNDRLSSGFEQLGWKIEYLRWQDNNHPQIVQVSKADLRIKLLINW